MSVILSVTEAKEDDPYSITIVKALLEQPSGFSSSFSEKQVYRLGDRVSIAVLKIYSENELKDANRIRKFLPLIEEAFRIPNLISIREDQKPRVTLVLLRVLQLEERDANLKKEILRIERSIRNRVAPD
jgi:hypothetical protein